MTVYTPSESVVRPVENVERADIRVRVLAQVYGRVDLNRFVEDEVGRISMVITLLGGDEIGKWRGELFGHPWPERKILPKVRKGYNYIWKVSPPKHPLLTV